MNIHTHKMIINVFSLINEADPEKFWLITLSNCNVTIAIVKKTKNKTIIFWINICTRIDSSFNNLYEDCTIPAIIPINGSCIAYIQNHTEVPEIAHDIVSDTAPKINPTIGPNNQPVIYTGSHENDNDIPKTGMWIVNIPRTILMANKDANSTKKNECLKILNGNNGKKKCNIFLERLSFWTKEMNLNTSLII